jgi:protein TonB
MFASSRDTKIFYYFLGAILFVHAVLLVTHIRDKFSAQDFPTAKAIKVKLIQEVLKEMTSATKRQIVQSEDSDVQKKTENAYLSDKDRSFERETVAARVDSFQQAALGNAAQTQKASQKSASKKKAFKDLKLSDFGMEAGEPVPKEATRAPASIDSVKGMENGVPENIGFSATNDYVEEVRLGDFTHLNTVEYKYYGFFHRIRQKLEQFWGNSIQEKARAVFRSGRRLPASEDLVTSLQVTLNAAGEIVAVKVTGASGVKELDDAAVESFNQAGPFPNPPKDLLVNGKAVIEWGFVVKS